MSWSDEFFALLEEEEKKKKKKKKEEENETFADNQFTAMARLAAGGALAPTTTNRGLASASSPSDVLDRYKERETAKKLYEAANTPKWFEKGALEDGDVMKTILGSVTDAGEHVGAGLIGLGEKAVDALAWMGNVMAKGQYYQNGGGYNIEADRIFEEQHAISKQATEDFIKKDLYDEEEISKWLISDQMRKIGIDSEKDSVFGEKSDQLLMSAGQLAGTAALQAAGVPWWLTTGLTSFGSETESALNQGATFEEAGFSGLVSAGAEILTEKISGGIRFGGKTLDDMLTKRLAINVSNKTVRTLKKLGMDMAGEGAEEVLSGYMSAIGQKLTYADEKELNELFSSEDAWDSFIGGMALGGFGSTKQALQSKHKGVDYVSGMTNNEQKVFDKVYEDAIKEAKKDGKLTKKEKAKIYDEVMEQMEKGYISTDTIEEVLGGDDFKAYKETLDSETSLTDELKALEDEYKPLNEKEHKTLADAERIVEIQRKYRETKAKIDDADRIGQRDFLKATLDKNVYEMTKGDRLVESFHERVRAKQKFQVDLSKYKGKAKEVMKQVMDSELVDNTNQSHEFWDMAAKIASDRSTNISVANNAQILEMVKKEHEAKGKTFDAKAFEGKIIDGYVSDKGIVLNAESNRALSFTVGHEITHTLEQAKHYEALQKMLKSYAGSEYQTRFDERKAQYSGIYSEDYKAKIDKEVTADLVGDYLFADKDFVKHLSTDKNVFQKIWDEVKYLCKVATAGSKEARELAKVQRAFEKAYRESGKAQTDTKYSVSDLTIDDMLKMSDAELDQYIQNLDLEIDDDILLDDDFSVEDISEKLNAEPEVIRTLYRRNGLGNSHVEDNHKAVMTQDRINKRIAEHGATQADYARRYITRISPKDFIDMTVYEQNMDRDKFDSRVRGDLDSKMGEWDYEKQLHDSEEPPVLIIDKTTGQIIGHNGRHRMRALEMAGIESVEIEVELHDEDGRLIKYNSQTIPDMAISSQFDTAIETHISNIVPLNNAHRGEIGKYYGEKAHSDAAVKYSVSDSDGKELTKGQQAYFKDSKMRDENGNLKVMYHGSQDAGFHVFDPGMSDDGTSLFFVDRNDVAASYSGTSETYEAQSIRTAKDMNKFLAEIGQDEDYSVTEKDGQFILLYDGERVAASDTAQGIYKEFCWYEGVGEGDANYKVYLNLTNPLEVDAGGRNWNNISREYSQEVADRYKSLTNDEKAALTDLAEWGEISIFRDEYRNAQDGALASAKEKLGEDVNLYDLFSIAEDSFSEDTLKQFAVKQMNTRDYAKKAKAEGYDGVIFKNIVDIGGYGGEYTPSTVAIAFDSNQVKSVANEMPTSDADIRFSLSKPVEQTKDLVALHNLTPDKLAKSLELGGMPMPSIAVTKADIPHSNFGEITLIFGRDTIDPKANKKNKVYSADAWTPVFPRVEYETDPNVEKRISNKLRDLEGKVDDYFRSDLRRVGYDFEDSLNRNGGEEGLIERVMDNDGMKAAYLEEQGKHIEKATKLEEAKKDYNPENAEKYQKIIDILGVNTAEEIGRVNLKDARDQHEAELEAVYPGITKSSMRMGRVFLAAKSYIENKDAGPVYNTVTDTDATQKAVDDALDAEGYEAWVRNLFSGIVKDSGVYNNKGYYTPSGNRRSFRQTHLPVTLENIVKAMATQNDGNAKNVSGFNGVKTLRAATAETFKSVEEMHKRKDRLQDRTQEQADALNDALQNRLYKVMEAIDNESGQIGYSNPYIRLDSIGETIAEIGESGKYSVADIQRTFKEYSRNISDDTAMEVKQLLYDVAQMPVNIFEAKPQRVVSFDEAKVFVVPNNVDAKLKQELLNRGYSIAEYDPNVEGDRQKVVNQFEEYKFSLSDKGQKFKTGKGWNVSGRDIMLQKDDIAPVQETVSEMESVAPVAEESTVAEEKPSAVLYQKRLNGWDKVYATAQEALNDAVRTTDKALWDAFNAEIENTPQNKPLSRGSTPIIDALVAVQEDVRQETITPMQGAQLLSEAYASGGANALRGLYNPKTGNLWDRYLEKAKQYETVAPEDAMFPDEQTPGIDELMAEAQDIMGAIEAYESVGDTTRAERLAQEYESIMEQIGQMEREERQRADSLTDADVPPEMDAPIYRRSENADPVGERKWNDVVGKENRKVKAYMYEHPEVKPFFQAEAAMLWDELQNTTRAERWYNDQLHYESGGEKGFGGNKRHTSQSIETMLDDWNMSYSDIEKGLNAIMEDNGAENISAAKKIEFMLNDRLRNGYKSFTGYEPNMDRYGNVMPNQEYIDTLNAMQADAYSKESFDALMAEAEQYAPVGVANNATTTMEAPVAEKYEAIKPKRAPSNEPRMVRADSKGKERKWVGTSTGSEAVDGAVTPDDIPNEVRYYQPIPNKKTLGNANSKLGNMGYDNALSYFNSQFANKQVSLDDIALGERLIQEAVKKGDTKTAGELIQNVAILGTELGQKVQALSIIKRLTPEGQLKMLQKTVERGKTKGDKAYEGVQVTEEMVRKILSARKADGSFDQMYLSRMVEDVKQQIADQMKVTAMDKVNAWRYLSMLGNPKTHIRNVVSNVAMYGTRQVKNALARTIEDITPIKNRTKTWKTASKEVKAFAAKTLEKMASDISGDKYSDSGSIKAKRKIFGVKALDFATDTNSNALSAEDAFFSKPAFRNALSEFLTANGIKTQADIKKNPELVAKAKQYAMEQAKEATFQQDSYLANKISEIERKNPLYNIAVGSVLPFKKTPINIAKAGLSYSPLGIARNIYDMVQVSKGNMDASEAIDHVAQTITGTSLTLVGYMLAQAGILNGAGDDDKEGDYDYQLGKQAYSFNFGGDTFSLSWLSPVAMPLFVGANAYEQLVEGKEWNADVVAETLAQTLDPLSEMSFLSSLDSVLSSYDSGIQKFMGIFETAAQNYVTQFVPTLSSQIAATFDDTKRNTKVAADSDFKLGDRLLNQIKYKIPGLRNSLEPSTDIWGNEIEQTESFGLRAVESFLAPWSKREDITSAVDEEIKDLYAKIGDGSVIPSIPSNTINYDDVKYEMSAEEYTAFKKEYGQLAYETLDDLFNTDTYKNADSETRRDMVKMVYDYARDEARLSFFDGRGVDFTNATEDKKEVYKENAIVGAIKADLPVDEYKFSVEYPEKYKFFTDNGVTYSDYQSGSEEFKDAWTWAYKNPEKFTLSKAVASDVVTYRKYTGDLYDIKADKDEDGKSISGSRKEKVVAYINNMDADYGEKIILFKSEYPADDTYNYDIIDYLNSREDISYEEMETILKELGFQVDSKGNVTWD